MHFNILPSTPTSLTGVFLILWVLTAVDMKITVFWDVTPCNLVSVEPADYIYKVEDPDDRSSGKN
jgi:hypothetical protein